MSVNQQYTISVEVAGAVILATSLSLQHNLGSPLPSASVAISHEDYIFVSSYGSSLAAIPSAKITVSIQDAIVYTYYGVVTNINGNENEIKLENTLTIVPSSYFATILTSSFSGVGIPEYLDQPFDLMYAIVQYFNNNVFASLGINPQLVLRGPVFTDLYLLPLSIAPRFTGMTCYDMLSAIARSFGLSVYFTWDNQVMILSLLSPVSSDIYVAKDMIKNVNFALDVPMAIYGSQGWPL